MSLPMNSIWRRCRAEAREPPRLGDSLFEPLRQCERGDLLRAQREQAPLLVS